MIVLQRRRFWLVDTVKSKDCTKIEGFQREMLELESSTFLFQGMTPVKQQSIIQCLYSLYC